MNNLRWALMLVFSITFVTQASAGPVMYLSFQSDPGDFVGQGETFDHTYVPELGTLFHESLFDQTISFEFGGTTDAPAGSVEFSTVELGVPLQIGTYTGAERAGFATAGHP